MSTNSNSHTIIYASVMIVIVAFLLIFVSSSLKTIQNKDQELDTKKQILVASSTRDVRDADAECNKYVKGDMLMNIDGTLAEDTNGFSISYEKEARENNRLYVLVCDVDGETKYVVPVYDAGFWGATWGYVALNADKDTVYGVCFLHASGTPGLGTETATIVFQGEFSGKKVLKDGRVALAVEKNEKVADSAYQVDGISNGIITSKGTDAMIKARLSQYDKFLINN